MNRGLKILLVFICSYFYLSYLNSQVSGVRYLLKYDTTECLYHACIVIAGGTATSVTHRTQANVQMTLIIPSTDSLEIVKFIMPIQANQLYMGMNPQEWSISNTVFEPVSQPGSNFYSIAPRLSPTAQYNNLKANDTIPLYSIRVFRKDGTVVKNCGGTVRFYINGVDPDSSAPGMNASDFSNGFTIGSINQLYIDNLPTVYPPDPIVEYVLACSENIDIDISAKISLCQSPMEFSWAGPGFTSTSEDVLIPSANASNNGLYVVTITDNLGCTSEISINTEVKPDAGVDKILCGSGAVLLNGSPSGGSWVVGSNPSGATLGATLNGNATVNFTNGTSGNFNFIYKTALCSDTMAVSVVSSLTAVIAGANSACAAGTTTLTASGGTDYEWSTGDLSSSIDVGPGTYTVTVSDASGCTGTTQKVIATSPSLTAVIAGANSACAGGTTTITASGGTDYEWSTGDLSNSIDVGPGTYTVTVSDASGCTGTTQKVIATSPSLTAVIAGANSACAGGTTTITASGGTDYEWSTGDLSNSIDVGPGTYTVTVSDASGCTGTTQKVIATSPSLTAVISGANSACAGGTTTITASGGTDYEWNTGDLSNSIDVGPGTYTVTVSDASGCTGTTQKVIATSPSLTAVIAGANSACAGGTTTLTASGGTVIMNGTQVTFPIV